MKNSQTNELKWTLLKAFTVISLCLFTVFGCESRSKSATNKSAQAMPDIGGSKKSAGSTAATDDSQPGVSKSKTALSGLPKGEKFETIWSLKDEKATADSSAVSNSGGPQLRLVQIDVSPYSLAIYVQHVNGTVHPITSLGAYHDFDGNFHDIKVGDSMAPLVTMLWEQCPVNPPRVAGSVTYNGTEPDLLVIPRVDLPKGDVDLTIEAFNVETGCILKNDEKGLRRIKDMSELNGYHESRDPRTGKVDGVEIRVLGPCRDKYDAPLSPMPALGEYRKEVEP